MENWWCNFYKIRRTILIYIIYVCLCERAIFYFFFCKIIFAFGTYCFLSHTIQLTLNIIMQWYGANIYSTWNGETKNIYENNNFFFQIHPQTLFLPCHSTSYSCFCCFDPPKCDFDVHLCKLKISTFENIGMNRNHVYAYGIEKQKMAVLSAKVFNSVDASKPMNQADTFSHSVDVFQQNPVQLHFMRKEKKQKWMNKSDQTKKKAMRILTISFIFRQKMCSKNCPLTKAIVRIADKIMILKSHPA